MNHIYLKIENQYGQLGLGEGYSGVKELTFLMNDKEIKEIICGGYFTFIWKTNGDIFVLGDNTSGEKKILT